MNRTTVARTLSVLAILFAALFYSVGARIKPGYSHVSSFISELNATGTAYATELGFAGFLPLGLILAAFLVTSARLVKVSGPSRVGYLLLWFHPLAFIGVVLAPCDAGCPIDGSSAQDLHNLLGVVTYFGAGLGFVLLSFAPGLEGRALIWRWFLRGSGLLWVLLFVLMLQPELVPWRGLLQRGADVLLAALLLIIAWRLIPTPPAHRRDSRAP